jgi:hypothetical protein
VGKTIQVVGTIALLEYFREYYNAHNKFPGYWGESRDIRLRLCPALTAFSRS